MQWSVLVLLLMGQCSLSSGQLYEFHFVGDEMSWEGARSYCREHYSDLATVYGTEDLDHMAHMMETLSAGSAEKGAWIGLHKRATGDQMLHWSLPGLEHETKRPWDKYEAKYGGKDQSCWITRKGRWHYYHKCDNEYEFFCHNDSKPSGRKKTWLDAQAYCRANNTDLISGFTQLREAKKSLGSGESNPYWIGLFGDTWGWSSGSNSSFRNWRNLKDKHNKDCAAVEKSGKWHPEDCNDKKPFFCYENRVILMKSNRTWEEALTFCRDTYDDLVSITSPLEQRYVQEVAGGARSRLVWLGLRYTCTLDFWFWVDGQKVRYENWDSKASGDDCDLSGAIKRGGKRTWLKRPDDEKYNFICSTC